MGYLNPLIAMGETVFCEASATAGVDGLLIVDMPPEEEGSLIQSAKTHGLDLIYLAAPTTTDERLQTIGKATSGYLYYVSLNGITGSSKLDTSEVSERVTHMRQHVSVPICVGFGIRTAEDAATISSTADGSIVGTVLVSQIEALVDEAEKIPNALKAILEPMRRAMDING